MIILIPEVNVNQKIPEFLIQPIKETFGQTVKLGSKCKLDTSHWNAKRRQYKADSILDAISLPLSRDRALVILDVDIYAFGLNFIFGEADMKLKKALISLTRLRPEFYGLGPNEALFKERILVEAMHELGHTYGLKHCSEPLCVMRFSFSIEDTDAKGWKFCSLCRRKLDNNQRSNVGHL